MTISKYFYNNLYNTVGDKLQEFLVNSPMSYREAINKDMQLNGWLFLNFEEQTNSQEITRAFDYLLYINGHFLADGDLLKVPKRDIPNFISSDQVISPLRLYKYFRHALVCTQVLAALNIYVEGDTKLSKDVTGEFYHNLFNTSLK